MNSLTFLEICSITFLQRVSYNDDRASESPGSQFMWMFLLLDRAKLSKLPAGSNDIFTFRTHIYELGA